MREAQDFLHESHCLANLLGDASDKDFDRKTLFKDWTIEDVIGHLHLWNYAAMLTVEDSEKFAAFLTPLLKGLMAGGTHPEIQRQWLDENAGGLRGRTLFDAWIELYRKTAQLYQNTDPQKRVAWAGPPMSAQSKIIARQMETWAHAQSIFDLLGQEREDTDRLQNIAHLGVTTYSWTFRNRAIEPPTPKPFVQLTAPSGTIWEWNDPQNDNKIEGMATQFCQVVTQTRNIADTALTVIGEPANQWMCKAQCFAGAPNDPPIKGSRYKSPV